MIKKFRFKYYLTIFIVITLVFLSMIFSVNILTSSITKDSINSRLETLLNTTQNIGSAPMDTPFSIRGNTLGGVGVGSEEMSSTGNIIVVYDSEDDSMQIWYNSLYDSEEVILEVVYSVMADGSESGNIGADYFATRQTGTTTLYVITDASQELALQNSMMESSAMIFLFSVVVIAFIAFLLSRWSIKPVEDAMQKQKQFISDASHELRTPLSVISINAELAKKSSSDVSVLETISSETVRMSELVEDMLTLSQLDEGCVFEKSEFSFSEAMETLVLQYEVFAYEKGKELSYDISEDIKLYGVESKIKQLAVIFIENAVKNAHDGTNINLSLSKKDKEIIFTVTNHGDTIDKKVQENIFERFYRADNSRNTETGGFGLGLSIARGIVELHQGKIGVSSENGETTFFATFKSKQEI